MLDFARVQGGDSEGQYMLLTCGNYFMASDGDSYMYIWGKVRILSGKEVLGFEPKNAANYIFQIGEGDKAVLIGGCRIHYSCICPIRPKAHSVWIAE